ncbi:MAG: hypothetical protein Q9160_009131, partial [Pyrenula sp. 1 TL-2023]
QFSRDSPVKVAKLAGNFNIVKTLVASGDIDESENTESGDYASEQSELEGVELEDAESNEIDPEDNEFRNAELEKTKQEAAEQRINESEEAEANNEAENNLNEDRSSPGYSIPACREPEVEHLTEASRKANLSLLHEIRCQNYVSEVKFSWDGRYLAAVPVTSVHIFNTSNGSLATKLETRQSSDTLSELKFARQGHSYSISTVDVSTDSRTAASGSDDRTIRLWDLSDYSQTRVIECENDVFTVSFSPDSKCIAAGFRIGGVTLFDFNTGSLLFRLSSDQGTVWSVAFSTTGLDLFSGSNDCTVKCFRLSPEDYKSGCYVRTVQRCEVRKASVN